MFSTRAWRALILFAVLCAAASAQPNLQGIWKARGGSAENVGQNGEIPYQPWAAAKKLENFASRRTADPLGKCYFPGVPRIMYLDFPFQIFQTSEHIAMAFEWSQVYRLIYVTGKPPLHEGYDSWMGNSRGRWEGDTLVVEVTDHND